MEKVIDIDGRNICYTSRGSGDTIVLLHGYLGSQEVWTRVAEFLSDSFHVLTVDLPGHGRSGVYGEVHSMEMMATKILKLLDYLGEDRVLMTGHSLGGYVALAFLELFPERLVGYSLFHSHPLADSNESVERRKREMKVVTAGRKRLLYPCNVEMMFAPHNLKHMETEIELLNNIAEATPDRGIVAILRGMIARPSRLKMVKSGIVPLLWVLGIHDLYIDYNSVVDAVKLPSKASLVTLHSSGHMGFVEEQELSVEIIREFAVTVFTKR